MLGPVEIPGVRVELELKTAPVNLSSFETIVDVEKFVSSTLIQLAAELRGDHWLGGNWGLAVLMDRLAHCGCYVSMDHDRR